MSGKQRTPRQLYRLGYAYGRKGKMRFLHPLRDRLSFQDGCRAGFAAFLTNSGRIRYASISP